MNSAMLHAHETFLQRCADLANLATSAISPNPRVGAVLVYENQIIGEGYFQQIGQSHAEVNCLNSVAKKNQDLIAKSTLYVSLEPCCFHGRTPACTSLIMENNIPKVVIGQLDQTAKVNGQGVAILEAERVEVLSFPSFAPAQRVALPRQLFATEARPYILLKYAQSADRFLAPNNTKNYWITGPLSRRLVHFWRSRTSAIVIGAGTLLKDDPLLTTRLYPGKSPLVCVFDIGNKISGNGFQMIIKNPLRDFILIQSEGAPQIESFKQVFIPLDATNRLLAFDFRELQSSNAAKEAAVTVLKTLFSSLADENINHITVEGGRWLLNLFLTAESWDEARVFTGTKTYFNTGLTAPMIPGKPAETVSLGKDRLDRWYRE